MGGGRVHCFFHRMFVSRNADDEARQRACQRYVFYRLLRHAVFSQGDTAVRAYHLDAEVRIRRSHSKLVETLAQDEGREARDEGDFAAGRQPGRHADHVGFLNPDVEEALGKLFAKCPAECGFGQIRIDSYDVLVRFAELEQRIAVRFTRRPPEGEILSWHLLC